MQSISKRNELLAQVVIKNLEKRNFEGYYCPDRKNAFNKVISLLSKDETISWGGSITLEQLKIQQYLKENNYKVIDRDEGKTPEERQELLLKSTIADTFLMSANAISEDGEIVNIDGLGNRVSALCFGPKKVIIVAGMNKVVKSLDDAMSRAKNISATYNAQRINSIHEIQTPCIKTGTCLNCKSETSICVQTVITRLSRPKGRIKVILVNENLGY